VLTYLAERPLHHVFYYEFSIAKTANGAPGADHPPALGHLQHGFGLEGARLRKAGLAIRLSTEVAVTSLDVRRLLPLFATRVAPFRGLVAARADGAFQVENRLVFIENVLSFADEESAGCFQEGVNAVQRMANRAVPQTDTRADEILRLHHDHTLVERLFKCVFVADQLGQTLDLA